jgi:glucokinase
MTALGLIADIGGTNARFALVKADGCEPLQPLVLPCADYANPAEAAKTYLKTVAPAVPPTRGAFAVACPILGDQVKMTNHVWDFSIAETRDALGLKTLDLVNDFTAVALSVPHLTAGDKVLVGGGQPVPTAPVAVLGPGTGLGVSAMIPSGKGWQPISTEGGHVTMAAANEKEAQVLGWLRSQFGHVSAERVLSGPGLVNIHAALRAIQGLPAETVTPAEVSRRALDKEPLAREAQDMFFAMLGTVGGNLALSLGARMLDDFMASDFRRRFEDKGRFRSYLEGIPVAVIIHPYPAFLGLAGLVAA